MWWTCNDSFKGERYCPIWLGINHSTNHNCVSFHFFTHSPPNPTPGEKNHTVQGRKGNEVQAILENIMAMCWCAMLFVSGKQSDSHFPSFFPLLLKDSNIFLPHWPDSARFSVGFSGEAFFLSEVVETACRVTSSVYANTIQYMCEMK